MTAEERATSFGSIATLYDAARPAVAPEALDWLLPPDTADVVDVGAGTGGLTRGLVDRVPHVVAVDPDDRMLEVLRRRSPAVDTRLGTAEDLPLTCRSVDAVVSAAAWHWFDPRRAPREMARVLRPSGRLGTVGTVLDPRVDWVADLAALLISGRGVRIPWDDVAAPLEGPFSPPERAEFRYSREIDVQEVLRDVTTWSTVFGASSDDRKQLLGQAETLLRHRFPDGRVEAVYRSLCFRCTRV